MVVGLSDDQWREFGSTLRAVHDSGLGGHLRGRIPAETFALPSAAMVRQPLALVEGEGTSLESPAATRFGGFWRENAGQIRLVLARAEGRIWLVDWDGPLVAPRERDLLFVVVDLWAGGRGNP